jgi:hypothetical protein
MLLPPGYSNIESMKRIRAAKITGKPQTIEDLVKNGVVIVGGPSTVREKLAEYQDLAGFNTSLTKTQFGTLPDDMARANMVAIAEEILPRFSTRLPAGWAAAQESTAVRAAARRDPQAAAVAVADHPASPQAAE